MDTIINLLHSFILLLYPFVCFLLFLLSAAVPSKRDLQSLVKVFLQEISSAAIDGDVGLVRSVCKETTKSIRLLLSKVEGIISSHPDTRKIVPGTGTTPFVRNSYQDHNVQLIVLLANLRESLDNLAGQVLKLVQDTSSSSATHSHSSTSVGSSFADSLSTASASSLASSLASHHFDASTLHSRAISDQYSPSVIQSVVRRCCTVFELRN